MPNLKRKEVLRWIVMKMQMQKRKGLQAMEN